DFGCRGGNEAALGRSEFTENRAGLELAGASGDFRNIARDMTVAFMQDEFERARTHNLVFHGWFLLLGRLTPRGVNLAGVDLCGWCSGLARWLRLRLTRSEHPSLFIILRGVRFGLACGFRLRCHGQRLDGKIGRAHV